MAQRTYILINDTAVQTLRSDLADWRKYAGMGKPLTVVVAEHAQRRSTRQNRLLHALLGEIAEHLSHGGKHYDVETLKEYARRRWVGTEEFTLPDGTRIERGLSTASLSVEEFGKLIDCVLHWAVAELEMEVNLTH